MSHETLIFLHISKTAGTSLRSIIQRQYPPEAVYDIDPSYFVSDSNQYEEVIQQRIANLQAMSDAEKRQLRCVLYPTAFGMHQLLPQSSAYVTMLRDPIDHFVSNFYFSVNKPGHIHHQQITEQKITIDTYLDHFEEDNVQTRRVSGVDAIDRLYNVVSPLPPSALAMAKENLNKIAVVGIMERFDESLLMMQDAFGWRDIRYEKQNVAPKRLKLDQLSPALRERLQVALAPDLELYDYAKSRFEEWIAQRNPQQWQQRLDGLQKQNVGYTRILNYKRKAARVLHSWGLRRK